MQYLAWLDTGIVLDLPDDFDQDDPKQMREAKKKIYLKFIDELDTALDGLGLFDVFVEPLEEGRLHECESVSEQAP